MKILHKKNLLPSENLKECSNDSLEPQSAVVSFGCNDEVGCSKLQQLVQESSTPAVDQGMCFARPVPSPVCG